MMNPEVKEGDKIVLVYMKDEQGMTPGTKGVVTRVTNDPFEEDDLLISVDWENGRNLSIVSAEDMWMLDSEEKETIQEQEEDYAKVLAKTSPFNATANATSSAMKQALRAYNELGVVDFWPVPLGYVGEYNLPGVSESDKLRKTKPETQQRFIQWYDDVIVNYDSVGTRGKTFEGLIAGIFGGDVEGNENNGSSDKTDVTIIIGPSKGDKLSIKFNKNFDGKGSQNIGGVTRAISKVINSESGAVAREVLRNNGSIKFNRNGVEVKGNNCFLIMKTLFNNKNNQDVMNVIETIFKVDDSFQPIDWFVFATEGNLNEINIYQYSKESIIEHMIRDIDNFTIGSTGMLKVKNLSEVNPNVLVVKFPQFTRTIRTSKPMSKSARYDFADGGLVYTISRNGDKEAKVRRDFEDDKIKDYYIEFLTKKKYNKEKKLDYLNRAIIKDIRAIESDKIDLGKEKGDTLEYLKQLSNKYQQGLYAEKGKLSSGRDQDIINLFGKKRGENINPFVIQYIRKNPDNFVKRVLDLYGDRPEVQSYLSTLTEQTKEDITKKLIDSNLDPTVIGDLLGSLTDEDITDLVMRNLDRKLFKGGDKEKNVRDYFDKYIKSLADRAEQDPNDDFDVEDEFLYGGEEPEKSKIGRKQFKNELLPLQVELLKLQEDVKKTGKAIAVVFEGRDSAGKGSTIKRMVEYLDPKYYNIIALGIPTKEERQDWFGRYEKHIEPGKINFFDRSWYNRGIVEPVMGYSSEEEYIDFMENVNDFEQSLIDRGIELVKFWLSITPETQKKRFQMRKASPLKYWKFSPNDEKSIDKWDKYTEYKNKVLKQTKEAKPWTVVDTNDKRAGILNAFRHLLKVVDYEGKDSENVGSVYPEVVTTIKEKEMTEAGNHHWTDWQRVSDVLGRENKILYDFFEKLRLSSVMNMLESTHFIYSGSDYLRRYIQFNQYENYDEDKYEELYDAADEAKHAMIRLSIESLERKGKETSLENINSEVKLLARQALQAFIMMK